MQDSQLTSFKKPVLIVEDEKDYLEILEDICSTLGIAYQSAASGSAALDLLNDESLSFSVFIIDLNLPGIHGKDLIQKIKAKEEDAIVIVQTGNITTDTIIHTMKLGVFDYIIKPLNFETFQKVILKALNYRYLIDQEKLNRKKSDRIIRDQIDWINYKNSIEFKSQLEQKTLTIDHLITSLSQGGGLGIMVTLMDLIQKTATQTEHGYLISEDVFHTIKENQRFAKRQIHSMTDYLETLALPPQLQMVHAEEIISNIKSCKNSLDEVIKIKNQTIVVPENIKDYSLLVDINFLEKAFQEILINAMKYSPEHSQITILTSVKDGFFWISFKNYPSEFPNSRIPENYEKIIMEPFFRINKSVDERYVPFEKYAIGLGLSAVENLVKKNNGVFVIHESDDYTTNEKKICILAEVLLPIMNED